MTERWWGDWVRFAPGNGPGVGPRGRRSGVRALGSFRAGWGAVALPRPPRVVGTVIGVVKHSRLARSAAIGFVLLGGAWVAGRTSRAAWGRSPGRVDWPRGPSGVERSRAESSGVERSRAESSGVERSRAEARVLGSFCAGEAAAIPSMCCAIPAAIGRRSRLARTRSAVDGFVLSCGYLGEWDRGFDGRLGVSGGMSSGWLGQTGADRSGKVGMRLGELECGGGSTGDGL